MADPAPSTFGTVQKVRQPLAQEVNEVLTDEMIERWLAVATSIVRSRFKRSFDTLVAAGKIDMDDVHMVCEIAAERVARNPDGFRQFGIDNGTGTRDQLLSDGQVKILPHEWARIYPEGATAYAQRANTLTLGTPAC